MTEVSVTSIYIQLWHKIISVIFLHFILLILLWLCVGIIRLLSLRLHSICSHLLGEDNEIYPQWISESESWEWIRSLESNHRSSLTGKGWELKGNQCPIQGVKNTSGSKLEYVYCKWIISAIILRQLWCKQSQHKLLINTV